MPKRSAGNTMENSSDLRSIALFAKVIESRSLTRAGRMLDMTTSSVSKRLAALEEKLGVRLLERTTRKVWPTEAGTAFYSRCERILTEVKEAERAVAEMGGKPRGLLRARVPAALGQLYIAPLSAEFLSLYPDIRLELVLSDDSERAVDDGFDVAVELSPLHDSSWIARRIATDRAVVCGSPAYCERRGLPLSPEQLTSHDCLHLSHRGIQEEWTFSTSSGSICVPVVPRAAFNHTSAIREAAIAGLGVARLPRLVVMDALRSGALQPLLEDFGSEELTVAVLFPTGKLRSPKVTAFVDFLSEALPARLAPLSRS
jgi:DNA-binding transcriptional LysR family regulator